MLPDNWKELYILAYVGSSANDSRLDCATAFYFCRDIVEEILAITPSHTWGTGAFGVQNCFGDNGLRINAIFQKNTRDMRFICYNNGSSKTTGTVKIYYK